MFNFWTDLPPIAREKTQVMTDKQFVEREISRFKASAKRREMLAGERYYRGDHDIIWKKRTAIGEDGDLVELENLPNNRVVDNQYKKLVDQKANYLLGQPLVFRSEDEQAVDALNKLLGKKRFMRLMKVVGKDSLNEGIVWLYPCYDDAGEFTLKKFKGHEIIPGWRDADHTILDYAIRIYAMVSYSGKEETIVEKVEVYDETGISYFELHGGELVPEEPYHLPYFTIDENAFNWARIPLIPFKRDSDEIPLIRNVKSLQDGLNDILSNFENNMDEDPRNTILVLVNYDGENLGEFRRNLATYGAVKVRTVDGAAGDLKTLQVEVNGENYKTILELFKKAIIENGMGYDAKDDRLGGQPNQMNIQSMYSDIDLDANGMETEFQAALDELLWFATCHLSNVGAGDYDPEEIEVIFNRDLPMNEGEVIMNIRNSVGILSDETLVAQHPWVDDVQTELKRKKQQEQEDRDRMMAGMDAFQRDSQKGDRDGPDGGDQ